MSLQDQIENIPGYDVILDYYNTYAEQHFHQVNPYEDDTGGRVVLPPTNTKDEQRVWKRIQAKAWRHDKCFMGGMAVGMDCGLGLVPVAVFCLPMVGPLMMYVVHARLISAAEQHVRLPTKLAARLHSNIVFDLLITFPPFIGSLFGWLHSCSTRNAGLLLQYLVFLGQQRANNVVPTYVGTTIEHEAYFGEHTV